MSTPLCKRRKGLGTLYQQLLQRGMQFNTIIWFCHLIKLLKLKTNYLFEKLKCKCKEIDTCFLCNVDVPPKVEYTPKTWLKKPMESVREILAEKYSDKQIVEVLRKEPVACRGKCNTILNNLTKLKNSFYYSFYL